MIEHIFSIGMLGCSAVLQIYWLRWAFLLMSARTGLGISRLPMALDSDAVVARTALFYLLGPKAFVERLDYRLLDCWCRWNRPFSSYVARGAIEAMGVELAGLAHSLAQSAHWTGIQEEPLAWSLRRPAAAHPVPEAGTPTIRLRRSASDPFHRSH